MAADEIDVVVVGAGQAGLAVSHELGARGIEHVVLERDDVGAGWAGRWDSFCLVTPNHTINLPGGGYHGSDPDGFLTREGIVAHLRDYARSFTAPVRQGVEVLGIRRTDSGEWRVDTNAGLITAHVVIMATGAYQKPHRPAGAADLAARLPVLDAGEYRNPTDLPDGAVLVVGSGQTGCQIAEELALSGRRVVLACGRAPWANRRLEGRDIVDWILDTRFMEQTRADLPGPQAVLLANIQATGARGGHDLHYRTLAALGVELVGHLAGCDDWLQFAPDLADSVAFGDSRRADLCNAILASCAARGVPAPRIPAPGPAPAAVPLDRLAPSELGLAIIAAGYRPAYTDVIAHPAAFDAWGFPIQAEGASTVLPGLFFIGTHFLRRRRSSLLMGVGDDATVVAEQVAALAA